MRERREYEYRAYHDTLTGLGNRFKCDRDSLERIFEAERKNRPFSLAVVDLDHFKKINDTYGHTAGDEVLSDFATFLRECVNGKGELYRWGGEEFVLLMPDIPRESAVELCEDLRRRIEARPFSSHGLSLTACFGVAQLSVEGETPVELFNRADRALYRAKKKGRNRVETAVDLIGETS
jgi:two-component system cell cycle response regulator